MLPSRRSARQAGAKNDVPVASRASPRIVQGLGILAPGDKMTASAAKKLVQRFEEPLSQEYIHGLELLTRLDDAALRVAAGLGGPATVAE